MGRCVLSGMHGRRTDLEEGRGHDVRVGGGCLRQLWGKGRLHGEGGRA